MNKKIFVLSTVVIFLSVLFQNELKTFLFQYFPYSLELLNYNVKNIRKSNLMSSEDLSTFNGIIQKSIYLAILGKVYDVTEGSKHYEKGAPYHYFAGKDGSRALITGEFTNEGPNRDHVLDLSCSELYGLINWRDTFTDKYIYKGKLIGRYYNADGSPTVYLKELQDKMKICDAEKDKDREFKEKYPPCNSEWSAAEGSRVWCSKNSGGVSRNWVGVPRQLYTPGENRPRCVCVNLTEDNSAVLLQEYENCPPASTACSVSESD